MGIIRLAVKVGLAGTAVYYLKEEGVWNESEVSLKSLDKLKETVNPHLEQIKAQVPLKLPKLPESEHIHHTIGIYWNKGVIATFDFLRHLPSHFSTWTDKGVDKVLENEEVKKFFDNLRNSSEPNKKE
ncbi:hypothetical protein HHI36_017785 [Cryptolaemus montrouzieri]|uniref:MICOS complex subunit MIC13 n=1 Tax=Cryptolaemus montrouzieri TaxID=559131 RepID=A0ABD2NQ52_9CUCU